MNLPPNARVYLDANILIYVTEGHAAFKQSIHHLFAEIDIKKAHLITSELSLMEVLVWPLRSKDDALVHTYEMLFTNLVSLRPITRNILTLAAQLRADTPKQRTSDSLHVATAILESADVFVTGDANIKNIPVGMEKWRV